MILIVRMRYELSAVYSGNDRYPLSDGVEAIGLHEMAEELAGL